MKIKSFIILLLVLSISACKTLNNNNVHIGFNDKINFRKLAKIIKNSEFKHDYFSSKIRVKFDNQTFTANLRMKKDSIIWMSLTGPFNIEGARLIILKNHFEMINKLNRTYYNEPLSALQKYIPISVDFNMLEKLILGNFLESKLLKQKIETKDQKYLVKGGVEGMNILYKLYENGKVSSVDILQKEERQSVSINYTKYETIENQSFPTRRKFVIKDKEKENNLDLKFYKWNSNKEIFPFVIPSSFIKK